MNKNFEVGTVRAEWKNNLDGYKIDYSDLHGFSLFAFLQSPSEEDIKKMSMNADLVIYFDDMNGVGFFTFNFLGTGGSAAFAPSLLLDFPKYHVPELLKSFPFHVYVIDSSKGELKATRTLSLSEEFSKYLSSWCQEADKKNLSLDDVKRISNEYFELLKQHDNKRSLKIAYETTNKCLEHEGIERD